MSHLTTGRRRSVHTSSCQNIFNFILHFSIYFSFSLVADMVSVAKKRTLQAITLLKVDFFLFDFNQGLSDHLGESVFALLGTVRGGCEGLLNFHFYFIIFVHLQMKFAYRFHKFFIIPKYPDKLSFLILYYGLESL